MCSSVAFGTVTWPCSCHHRPPSPGRLHLPKGKLSRIEHAPPPPCPTGRISCGSAWVGPGGQTTTRRPPGKLCFLGRPSPPPGPFILYLGSHAGGLGPGDIYKCVPTTQFGNSESTPQSFPSVRDSSGRVGLPMPPATAPRLPCVLRVGRPRETPVPPRHRTKNPESSAGSWPWMSENAGTGAFGGASTGGGVARRSPRGPSVGCA